MYISNASAAVTAILIYLLSPFLASSKRSAICWYDRSCSTGCQLMGSVCQRFSEKNSCPRQNYELIKWTWLTRQQMVFFFLNTLCGQTLKLLRHNKSFHTHTHNNLGVWDVSVAGQEASESCRQLPLLLRRHTCRKHVPLDIVSSYSKKGDASGGWPAAARLSAYETPT